MWARPVHRSSACRSESRAATAQAPSIGESPRNERNASTWQKHSDIDHVPAGKPSELGRFLRRKGSLPDQEVVEPFLPSSVPLAGAPVLQAHGRAVALVDLEAGRGHSGREQ